jgi:hypothetical protein
VEGRGEVELHACQGEQLTPEIAGEDQIMIKDDGVGDAMQLDQDVEECSRHSRRHIRMAEQDEVRNL